MLAKSVMPLFARVTAWNAVLYIGKMARSLSCFTPGASSLSPFQASAAGPMVTWANSRSPVCTSVAFCTGPPVTSPPPGMPSASETMLAQPEPYTKYVPPWLAVPTVKLAGQSLRSSSWAIAGRLRLPTSNADAIKVVLRRFM